MKKLLLTFIVFIVIILICSFNSGDKLFINVGNKFYSTGSSISNIEENYNALKSTIEADSNRTTGDFFDTNINCATVKMGLGFNFGNELDWDFENRKVRRYKIRISVGNDDTEYYYYDSYVSELANLFDFGNPKKEGETDKSPNRSSSTQNYANLELTENTDVSFSSTSPINNIKIYVSNAYSEAIGKDVIVDVKYLKLLDKNGTDIINDNSVLQRYTANVQATDVNVVTIPLNTTVGDFYGTDSKILADIQLDNYISDYKNNPTKVYQDTYNGAVATDEELQFLKDSGFSTIRLPSTWYAHVDSSGTIDPEWFDEVNSVVDRILSYGFYVIVNMHHDGGKYGWIKADKVDFARNEYLYRYIVLQIAENFKNYGDRLILAGPNEVTNYQKHKGITSTTSRSDIDTFNKINQVFVDEVRRTGYNNTNRLLMVSTWYAHEKSLSSFVEPTDSANDKIFTEIHDYSLQADGLLEALRYLQDDGSQFLSKYHIVMGEFGIKRTESLISRMNLMKINIPLASQLGIPMILWDDGGEYAIMKKTAAEWDENYDSDQVANALITSYSNHPLTCLDICDCSDSTCCSECAYNPETTKKITITKVWENDSKVVNDRPTPKLHLAGEGDVSDIPVEYQKVENIVTSGGYIDTDIPFNESYTLYGDGNSRGAGYNGSIIDGYTSNSVRTGLYMLTGSAASPNLRWQAYWTGLGGVQTITGTTTGIDMTSRYQYTQNSSGVTFTQGNTTYSYTYSKTANSTLSSETGNYRIAGNIQNNRSEVYFYEAKIFDSSNNLIHDFKPCYRKTDSVVGVYDVVGRKFYLSTGSVSKGADMAATTTHISVSQVSKDKKWVKNVDNTWTYVFFVDNNDISYTVYEEAISGYNISNGVNNPKTIVNDEATITNTLKTISNEVIVTTKWVGDENALDERPDDITVYLKEAPVTMFISGESLNRKMKKMAGNSSTGTGDVDTNITSIRRSSTLKSGLTDELNKVSTDSSTHDIYMWYENGIIYYYTEAKKVYLNTSAKYMFSKLQALSDISELANFDTSRVTDMGFMFQDDISITDLSPLANWDVSCVQNMKLIFAANSSTVTNLGGMQIQSLEPLASWDTQSLTNLEQAFKGCTQITSLAGLNNWDVSNVTDLTQTFEYNSSLTDYNSIKQIEDWDVSAVTAWNWMFQFTNIRYNSIQFSFTVRPGSVSDYNGTYETSVSANPKTYNPKTPTSTLATYTSGTWTKSGNTWTYTFNVPTEFTEYYVYEDEVSNYTSDALYENKILAENDEAIITNTLNTFDITVKKIITGNMSDGDETFSFTVKIFDLSDDTITTNVSVETSVGSSNITSTSNGFTVNLEHNEQVVVKNIPAGYSYSIEENNNNYLKYYKIEKTDDNTSIIAQTSGMKAEGTLTENQTVTFTNNKESVVNTGMFISIISFIILSIIVSGFLVFFKINKHTNYIS